MVAEFSGSREQTFHSTMEIKKRDIHAPDVLVPDIEKELLGIGDETQKEKGIPREHITAYAQRIRDIFHQWSEKKEGYKVIVDALSSESIIEQIMTSDEYRSYLDELSVKEIQQAVDGLRKAVIHELAALLEPDEFVFLLENIKTGSSRVDLVQGRSEKPQVLRRNDFPTSPERTAALERYAALPPHPRLLSIKDFGAEGRAVLVERLKIMTVGDVLSGKITLSPAELLRVLSGASSGLLYLEQHGLMLQDICPANIGVDRKTRQAIMFDLDGLFPLGVESNTRVVKTEYIPPELYNTRRPPVTDAKEMVYQLGEVFDRLRAEGYFMKGLPMTEELEVLFRNILFELAYDMRNPDPDNRITLGEVVDRTKRLFATTLRMEELVRERRAHIAASRPPRTRRPTSDRMAV